MSKIVAMAMLACGSALPECPTRAYCDRTYRVNTRHCINYCGGGSSFHPCFHHADGVEMQWARCNCVHSHPACEVPSMRIMERPAMSHVQCQQQCRGYPSVFNHNHGHDRCTCVGCQALDSVSDRACNREANETTVVEGPFEQ
jgi:hypothetical protein